MGQSSVPGPPNLGDNRFTLLANPPRAKKKRTNQSLLEIFPDLPTVQKPDPKYIVISATSGDKNLQEYSCFSVHRSLKLICSDIISVSELRDGNLLLLVGNKTSAENIINTKNLPGICNIKCEYHSNLNFSKGTIYAPYLNSVPEAEIVNELKSQGVVDIYKYQRKNTEGKMAPCGVMLLTFDRYSTPEKLEISWHKVKVRQFFPNPMRCKNCQMLGHTQKWCKNTPKCEICALPPHIPVECTRTLCVNCSEEHPSSAKECKIFQQQKEILKIKTKQKCSLKSAKEKFHAQTLTKPLEQTYSEVTNNKFNTKNLISNNSTKNSEMTNTENKPTNLKAITVKQPTNNAENEKNSETPKIIKTITNETKTQKTAPINKKPPLTITTRSMAKHTNNNPTTSNSKKKETLNLTQNKNLNLPKQITHNASYDEQEEIMFLDEE